MADITKGVRAFTIGTAVSRVFGLGREMVFAFLYGASNSTDAFQAAFRILDLFRDLFAESTLSAAAVPVLSEQKQKSKDRQNLLANNLFNILIVTVGIIVIACIVLSPLLTRLLAAGFVRIPGKIELTTILTGIMLPFLLFLALAAWAMSYLNTENEFFTPSLAPAFFNVVSVIVPVMVYGYLTGRNIDPIYGMAWGVLAGGVLQFLVQLPMLFSKGFRYRFVINFKDPGFRKILSIFVPIVIGLAGSRINIAVSLLLISFVAERSMTWLHYAFRIYHLPLGLFGVAVGTVILPTLSQYAVNREYSELKKTIFDSFKLVLFLTISSSIIIAFLAYPAVRILYERGRFTPFDTSATAQALILFMIGVPFAGGLRNVASVYYAFKDAKTPMYASLISIGFNIVMNLALMWVIGFRAFPLATSVSALINISILIALLPKKIGKFELLPFLRYFLLMVGTSVLGGLAGFFTNNFLLQLLGSSFICQVLSLLLSITVAYLVFYVSSYLIGLKEVVDYTKRLLKRHKKDRSQEVKKL